MQRDMARGLKSRPALQLELSKIDDQVGRRANYRTHNESYKQPMDLSISSLNANEGLKLFEIGPPSQQEISLETNQRAPSTVLKKHVPVPKQIDSLAQSGPID